jgi:hypothetical protein
MAGAFVISVSSIADGMELVRHVNVLDWRGFWWVGGLTSLMTLVVASVRDNWNWVERQEVGQFEFRGDQVTYKLISRDRKARHSRPA